MGLIRTAHGWTYPDPGPCPCGAASAVCGWAFCMCAGAIGGGHPSWRCRACDSVQTLGCVGRVEVLNEYGGHRQRPRAPRVEESHAMRASCRRSTIWWADPAHHPAAGDERNDRGDPEVRCRQ